MDSAPESPRERKNSKPMDFSRFSPKSSLRKSNTWREPFKDNGAPEPGSSPPSASALPKASPSLIRRSTTERETRRRSGTTSGSPPPSFSTIVAPGSPTLAEIVRTQSLTPTVSPKTHFNTRNSVGNLNEVRSPSKRSSTASDLYASDSEGPNRSSRLIHIPSSSGYSINSPGSTHTAMTNNTTESDFDGPEVVEDTMEGVDPTLKLILRVEIEDYVVLNAPRSFVLVFLKTETAQQALLRIAKRPQTNIEVDDALHNYLLYIPNFDPNHGRGICMSNARTLSSYGLSDRDSLVVKKRLNSYADLSAIVRPPKSPHIPLSEYNNTIERSTKLRGKLSFRPVTGVTSLPDANTEAPKLLGEDLADVCQRSSHFGLPTIFLRTVEFLEQKGLEVPEVFQKSGPEKEVTNYIRLFELGEDVQFGSDANPYVVSDILKLFLTKLPEPLLTYQLYELIVLAEFKTEVEFNAAAAYLISKLPLNNKVILSRFMEFMFNLQLNQEKNNASTEVFFIFI